MWFPEKCSTILVNLANNSRLVLVQRRVKRGMSGLAWGGWTCSVSLVGRLGRSWSWWEELASLVATLSPFSSCSPFSWSVRTFLIQTFGFAFLKYILKTRMFRLTRSINKETTLNIMGWNCRGSFTASFGPTNKSTCTLKVSERHPKKPWKTLKTPKTPKDHKKLRKRPGKLLKDILSKDKLSLHAGWPKMPHSILRLVYVMVVQFNFARSVY